MVGMLLVILCIGFMNVCEPAQWALKSPVLARKSSKRVVRIQGVALGLRGGSTMPVKDEEGIQTTPVTLIVSTNVGNPFLDKKKRLQLQRNATVAELKTALHNKFPGAPPVQLQHIYFGMNELSDTQLVGNITGISPVPLVLDMLTGTSAYNKTMSVRQAIDAYAALQAQQAYVGTQTRALFDRPAAPSAVSESACAAEAGVGTSSTSSVAVSVGRGLQSTGPDVGECASRPIESLTYRQMVNPSNGIVSKR